MAYVSTTGNNSIKNIFLESNDERKKFAGVLDRSGHQNWARIVMADSGNCRVYRCRTSDVNDFRNKGGMEIHRWGESEAERNFNGSSYNKTLRDFTDDCQIKNSLKV